MSSKAVHLEISQSMETDSFINALRRFICRRGNVTSITSDNGSNLKGSDRQLKECIDNMNQSIIENELKRRNIIWNYNPPTASNHGGFYEREIRSVRKVLTSIMNGQNIRLNDEELHTYMCEVEAILNSRPLTEVTCDSGETEPLTPNHILLLKAGVTYPPGLFDENDLYVRRRWRQVQYLSDQFWRRWKNEYLVLLQRRQKWCSQRRQHEVGDLVLAIDVDTPRNQWPLGRIVHTKPDKDGNVRSVDLRVSKCQNSQLNDFSTRIITRPINKLILLRRVNEL